MGRKDNIISTEKTIEVVSGHYLRLARQNKGMSLTQLATLLKYSKSYLSGVENNFKQGSRELVEKYEEALALPAGVLVEQYFTDNSTKITSEATSSSHISYLPYTRNPFFTDRDMFIERLYRALYSEKAVAVTLGITGPGGIGKTQIALEYAYRFQDNYKTVLLIRIATSEQLSTDINNIAHILDLAEKQRKDQKTVIEDIKCWLQQNHAWLLVLDEVSDFRIVQDLLPTKVNGHILITTRSQTIGRIAQRIDVEQMSLAAGTLFLLRRATMLGPVDTLEAASTQDIQLAEKIVYFMGGLPLALDQAGAYIEETRCGLDAYLSLLQKHRAPLLARRGKYVTDHPASVATTLSLAFEKVRQANPCAMDLLSLSAFLKPDNIPEKIFTQGGTDLGPALSTLSGDQLAFDEAIAELLNYSLISRNPDHTLTIHPLVQVILQDGMDRETQSLWAERAAGVTGEKRGA